MYGSPARMRLEQQSARRGNAPVVITTVLSLLVVAAAVAAVAWLVLRTPSEAVDSAERLEPVGTALPAPTEQPTLPTPIPTQASEPAAPGFTGEAPEVSALPTVAAPQAQETEAVAQDVGPTPTPRVVALPTAPAVTLPAAQPTPLPAPALPPAVPVEAVPVVALEPVEVAQPAPTVAAETAEDAGERERRTEPEEVDDDPFNIFGDGDEDGSRIVAAQNDALERARVLQDDDSDDDADRAGFDPVQAPVIVPADVASITERRDGSMEIVMPDVDAMIDEITASVTDPNRNPNVGDAGRANDNGRERDDDRELAAENRRRSARDRMSDRNRRTTAGNSTRSDGGTVPGIQRGSGPSGSQNNENCESPFENLPEDRRPQGFPFDDC